MFVQLSNSDHFLAFLARHQNSFVFEYYDMADYPSDPLGMKVDVVGASRKVRNEEKKYGVFINLDFIDRNNLTEEDKEVVASHEIYHVVLLEVAKYPDLVPAHHLESEFALCTV
jgi:hypothetical protein